VFFISLIFSFAADTLLPTEFVTLVTVLLTLALKEFHFSPAYNLSGLKKNEKTMNKINTSTTTLAAFDMLILLYLFLSLILYRIFTHGCSGVNKPMAIIISLLAVCFILRKPEE
jgi:hypothetical protein